MKKSAFTEEQILHARRQGDVALCTPRTGPSAMPETRSA